jgi:transcriptional regulator with XRE-family HTH domain
MPSIKINHKAVRRARILSGYSVVRFAEAVGVNHTHISNIEAGRRSASPEVLQVISRLTGVPMAELLHADEAAA